MGYKKNKIIALFILCCLSLLMIPTHIVKADTDILPTTAYNLNVRLQSTSALVAIDSGYMRVFYSNEKIGIEYYDDNFQIQSKKFIEKELDLWGGFYASSDAYYIVEGKDNREEIDTAEVIRVTKYDTNWNRLGAASVTSNPELFGGEIRFPFDTGCVEMEECNGLLYIVTGHQGYVDEAVGQGHQGFLMVEVDEASMTGKIVKCDLWHSFAQYIKYKDSYLYILEQSEGSRYTKIGKCDCNNLEQISIPVLKYGGERTSPWAVSCYASVDDLEISSNNVLCIGTSIDQSKYDVVTSDMAHNIYLTVTPIDNFSEDASSVKWLTNYNGGGKSFLGVKLVKVNDNRFLVMWEEYNTTSGIESDDLLSANTLHYVFIDGAGNKISSEYNESVPISDCNPIVKDSKIVYYASSDNMVNFYSIDTQTGELSKKVYRLAGENVEWSLDKGILTIYGSGEMSFDPEAKFRFPVSSVSRMFAYSLDDNAWGSIREGVEKIVIRNGVTGISNNAFTSFNKLKEVEIENGLLSIGEQAFYNCDKLDKVVIPSSVTSIGDDIVWTGAYWVSNHEHVVYAAIYGKKGSYAEEYANKNGIVFKDIDAEDDVTEPTSKPTGIPVVTSTAIPEATPIAVTTFIPAAIPTVTPSAIPVGTPAATPTVTTSAIPVETPIVKPVIIPTIAPTSTPIVMETIVPTERPKAVPTVQPTVMPTVKPVVKPTDTPKSTTQIKAKIKKVKAVKKKVTIKKNKISAITFKIKTTNNRYVKYNIRASIKKSKIAKITTVIKGIDKVTVDVKGLKKGKTVLKINIGGKKAKTTIKVK